MSDLISRQAVLDKFQALCDACGEGDKYNGVMCRACALDDGICIVEDIPSAEPIEEFEWCHDCKEYDQEKHCCHRWTKVIRQTVEEVKSQYALEYPKIIHCEDCKFYTPMNRALKTGICSLTMHHLGDDGFCSDAEKRGE